MKHHQTVDSNARTPQVGRGLSGVRPRPGARSLKQKFHPSVWNFAVRPSRVLFNYLVIFFSFLQLCKMFLFHLCCMQFFFFRQALPGFFFFFPFFYFFRISYCLVKSKRTLFVDIFKNHFRDSEASHRDETFIPGRVV